MSFSTNSKIANHSAGNLVLSLVGDIHFVIVSVITISVIILVISTV